MKAWRTELLRIAPPILAGLGLGWGFRVPGWGLAGGALVALAWQLLTVSRLLSHVDGDGAARPRGGLAGEFATRWDRRRRREAGRRAELVRLRRELAESTRAMPDAAIVLDADGAIRWANKAACRWFGLDLPGDLGRPLVQLVRDPLLVERLGRRERPGEIEIASPTAAGNELLVHVAPYGEGRTLLLARDVTRLKRLERMRRDFVANVSHELRSPLTVVSGYLELMGEDAETPPTWANPLAETRRQVARMVAIVRDLLELARLESDSTPPPRTPVDLASLVDRARAQIVAGGIGKRDIATEVPAHTMVLGAETELESAVGNLISNAVKYTADDGRIAVSWRDADSGGELTVADDGIGIPQREIPRLTERFYRVDKARSARSGGTGLGLAIVKHVAERHGVRLGIESEVGAGSRFTLVFPAGRIERAAKQPRGLAHTG